MPPGFEDAGNRPRLRWGAAWRMRRIAIKDLADLAEPGIGEVVADRLEPSLGRQGVTVNPVMR